MKALYEASGILGASEFDDSEMTTKLIEPMDGKNDDFSVSRIPKEYHITKTFPIFPKDYADQGYRVYNKDGLWNVVIWPSNNPDSREDVIHLSDAVRLMLDELQGDMSSKNELTSSNDVQKSKQAAAQLIQLFDRRVSLLKVALDELTRQVSKHCTERGTLLAYLIENLLSTFKEIPGHYNNALKIQKKEVDQLRVALDAKNMEIQSQAKDLNERIQLMVIERRMEKEWHAQLEDQLAKWKQQLEGYKQKAQEQIKLERDMLEQQIAGMREVISDLRLENDAYKEQIQFQRSELLKSEKRYAELESQLAAVNQKNEKLQMQLSKQGTCGVISRNSDIGADETGLDSDVSASGVTTYELSDGSKLKQLLIEFPPQRSVSMMSQKELTQTIFGLFESLYKSKNFTSFDDFYCQRLLMGEDTPQIAADTARTFLDSLMTCSETFALAQITLDFIRRKVNDALLHIFISFFGFYRAQPFQGPVTLDPNTDVPSIPLSQSQLLVSAMFSTAIGDAAVKEINDMLKSVAVEERGKEPFISVVTMLDLTLRKVNEYFNKRMSEVQNNFTRTYTRFMRGIIQKLPGCDQTNPRMDWKTFRDFMKQLRPELTTSQTEKLFMDSTQFSDSIASVTADAFDTMCISRQIYINSIRVPGSGKRLRYVPPDMLQVIENAWKSSLRTSVKKAITELSKNENSQGVVTTLRTLDQRFEDTLKISTAGPLCVQMLHEAATIISNEAVSIASSLPIDKCLAIMERQIRVLNGDDGK